MDKKPATTLIIFGSTGNLVQKKLIPSLYHLLKDGFLPDDFNIVCVARDYDATIDSIVEKAEISLLRQSSDINDTILGNLKAKMKLFFMDSTNGDDYVRLRNMLDGLDAEKGLKHNRLYYLAIPPDIFPVVVECLGRAGLNNETDNVSRRILVEKPFGTNLETARRLVSHISQYFNEQQVYRIDHYLAKETAQNILAFRFNNPLIEDLWGRQFIDHIQITSAETIDIEGRANFYDNMGALRDLVQSHLLQLLALTMMEVPYPLDSANIHAEKLALLNAIKPIKPKYIDDVAVRGQYAGYKQEALNDNSTTETYAALHFEVANSRWGGIPVLVRTGKALAEKMTEISVVFKDRTRRNIAANILTIRIQPNEGISIRLQAKKPGFKEELQNVNMDFCYQTSFNGSQPDAYERVLVDAIVGDQSLFATSEEVLRCWEILEPVLQNWQASSDNLFVYEKGTWGPKEANELANNYGCEWLFSSSHSCAIHTAKPSLEN
jgi:glucose-6-phosphate 1-dehydrogenase